MAQRLLLVVLASLVTVGCVGSSRSLGDYREKAANTAESMISTLETARLVTSAALDGDTFARYLSLVLSEAEDDAGSISEAFQTVQPPEGDESDRIRAELDALLDAATNVLADLRIAAYRDDRAALAASADRLPDLTRRFERYQGLATT